jgi:hypothetical protein
MLTIIGILFVTAIGIGLIMLYAEAWHKKRETEAMREFREARKSRHEH